MALNTVPQEATGGCSQSGVVVEVVVGWGGRLAGDFTVAQWFDRPGETRESKRVAQCSRREPDFIQARAHLVVC